MEKKIFIKPQLRELPMNGEALLQQASGNQVQKGGTIEQYAKRGMQGSTTFKWN